MSKDNDKESKFYKGSEFKRLQMEWYSRLKKDGFKSMENLADIEMNFINRSLFKDEPDVANYFSACEEFLNIGELTPTERFVWKLHSSGMSERSIHRKLFLIGAKPTSWKQINTVLNRIAAKAGIRRPLLR